MKKLYFLFIALQILSCRHAVDPAVVRNEVREAEKAFEKMVSEKGMAEAFSHFAGDSAVILRGNDSLIVGKEGIKHYYQMNSNPAAMLNWTPDYIHVSKCGTLAYTYGKYIYSVRDSAGRIQERSGFFHTVWRKQNNEWKYVWD